MRRTFGSADREYMDDDTLRQVIEEVIYTDAVFSVGGGRKGMITTGVHDGLVTLSGVLRSEIPPGRERHGAVSDLSRADEANSNRTARARPVESIRRGKPSHPDRTTPSSTQATQDRRRVTRLAADPAVPASL
jgi:hypothetical protein